MLRRSVIVAIAGLLVAPSAAPQVFGGNSWAPQADRQMRNDEVPFAEIKRNLERRLGGQMLQSTRRGDRHVIIWLDRDDNRLEIQVDARSGRVISERGAGR